jgi:5-methylcytosine-specific restriction endonuclease McrA
MPWQNDREARRQSDATYQDPEYKRNRPIAMRRDQYRCQIRSAGCLGGATMCDHIVNRASGGGHGVANLQAACAPCHAAKTAREGGGYRSGSSTRDPSPQPRTAW